MVYRGPVRRTLATCGIALAASLAGAGVASPAVHQRVGCKQRAVGLLFWPRGHAAVPSVGFPRFLVPHAELYRPGPPYPDARALGGVLPGGGSFEDVCSATPIRPPGPVESVTTVRQAATISCAARKALLFERVDASAKSTLRIYAAGVLLLRMTIARSGSSVSFDSRSCKRSAPPS